MGLDLFGVAGVLALFVAHEHLEVRFELIALFEEFSDLLDDGFLEDGQVIRREAVDNRMSLFFVGKRGLVFEFITDLLLQGEYFIFLWVPLNLNWKYIMVPETPEFDRISEIGLWFVHGYFVYGGEETVCQVFQDELQVEIHHLVEEVQGAVALLSFI